MFFTNLFFSMDSLRGRLVATIFVMRFFPQKIVWKIDWKCWLENLLENWMENLLEKMLENMLEIWLEKMLEKCVGNLVGKNVGNVGWKFGWKICWKCWVEIWMEKMLEKMLVNGCEIIGEKIVATNLPLRLSTTIIYIYIIIISYIIIMIRSSKEFLRPGPLPSPIEKTFFRCGYWLKRGSLAGSDHGGGFFQAFSSMGRSCIISEPWQFAPVDQPWQPQGETLLEAAPDWLDVSGNSQLVIATPSKAILLGGHVLQMGYGMKARGWHL